MFLINEIAARYTRLAAGEPGAPVFPRAVTSTRMNLSEAADLLRNAATPPHRVDAVWRHMVSCARADDSEQWTIIAVGLAAPGLRHATARVGLVWPHGDSADLEAEVLAGFIAGLESVSLWLPRVCSRLVQRAYSAGRTYARGQIRASRAHQAASAEGSRHQSVAGHVDLVLSRAVGDGVISAADAGVIAETRLERQALTSVASRHGVPATTMRRYRARAEQHLADWLADHH